MLDAQTLLTIVLLCAVGIAAWWDYRTREVPDLASLGLIVVGLLGNLVIAITYRDPMLFAPSAVGAAVGFGFGWLLYRAHQWGGGDVKLLTGVGAVIGLWVPELRLFAFLILLAFAGVLWGVGYSAKLIVQHRRAFHAAFVKRLRTPRVHRTRQLIVLCGILGIILLLFVPLVAKFLIAFVLIGAYLVHYSWIISRTLEEVVLIKQVRVRDLVEGDWLTADVMRGKRTLVRARATGVDAKDIAALRRAKVRAVTVREGIPFVPAFLLATIFLLALESQGVAILALLG